MSWDRPPLTDAVLNPVDAYCGEVANNPPCTVAGSPASRTVPTRVQRVPSAES